MWDTVSSSLSRHVLIIVQSSLKVYSHEYHHTEYNVQTARHTFPQKSIGLHSHGVDTLLDSYVYISHLARLIIHGITYYLYWNPAKKLVTISFNLASVSGVICPSAAIVFRVSCWLARRWAMYSLSKAVMRDGSILSRWPRTPA